MSIVSNAAVLATGAHDPADRNARDHALMSGCVRTTNDRGDYHFSVAPSPLDNDLATRQVVSMDKYRLPLWVPLAILFAVGGIAFVLPAWTSASVSLAKLTGISESWAGFAGSVTGAMITLIAATLAYLAALQQIGASERIAMRREMETLAVMKSELRITFSAVNQVWRIADWALEPGIDNNRRSYRLINAILNFDILPTKDFIDDAKKYAEGLSPIVQRDFMPIVHWLELCDVIRTTNAAGPSGAEPIEMFRVRVLSHTQTVFTALAQNVVRFDPELGKIFDGRRRSDRFAPSPSQQTDMMFEMLQAREKQLFDHRG
jgi:hypothetical protein